MNRGIAYAFFAYVIWGLFPFYFKALEQIPAYEILVHRMAWSLLFITVILCARRHWAWVRPALRDRHLIARFCASAVLLSANWGIYIWAVNTGHVVEASLGYFVNPLVNILFGYVFLRERLRPRQWCAVLLAALGVAWLTRCNGAPPWISLALALTFGGYGLLRKTAKLGTLEGLALETALLFPVAIVALTIMGLAGTSHFMHASLRIQLLLAAAGPVTAVPLLFFGAAARRIPLSTLGLIQYVTPTLQLLTGVLIYGERFGLDRAVGFGVIWIALALYSLEGVRGTRMVARGASGRA
jgi:chloramphenicol-sensitive protein RarD